MAFEMTDIQKELQKLKALINQRQSTAIFSNKANESTKLALGDVELYINDMTRKFSFTAAGVKNPVLVDPKRKALENVEYLNGIKVDDITSVTADVEALKDITTTHTSEIADCQSSIIDIERKDIEQDERLDAIESYNYDSISSGPVVLSTYNITDTPSPVQGLRLDVDDENVILFGTGPGLIPALNLNGNVAVSNNLVVSGDTTSGGMIVKGDLAVRGKLKAPIYVDIDDTYTNGFYVLKPSLATDATTAVAIGKAAGDCGCGALTYRNTSTPEFGMGFWYHDFIISCKRKPDQSIPNIYLRGYTSVTDSVYVGGSVDANQGLFCNRTLSVKGTASITGDTHISSNLRIDGDISMKTGTKTTAELKFNWLNVVTIPVAMTSASNKIVMSRNDYMVEGDDYLEASFTFKDAKGNVVRTYELSYKFTKGGAERVYIVDGVLWTPNSNNYELIFEDLPYDSTGRAYVDCSELNIYHDYTSDVITKIIDTNGNVLGKVRDLTSNNGTTLHTADNTLRWWDSDLQNGESVYLDVPAKVINSKVMIPVRKLAEMLNADVDWDQATKCVHISR